MLALGIFLDFPAFHWHGSTAVPMKGLSAEYVSLEVQRLVTN